VTVGGLTIGWRFQGNASYLPKRQGLMQPQSKAG